MKKQKLSEFEKRILAETLAEQAIRVGVKKSDNKGFSDLPLFLKKSQTEIF